MAYEYGVAIIGDEGAMNSFYANRRNATICQVEMIENPMKAYEDSPGVRVYWAPNEKAADDMAARVTEKHPAFKAVVFKSVAMVSRAPGPVGRAVFSDKGLLPV